MEYIIDEHGKWEDYGNYRVLVEESQERIEKAIISEQQRLEEELFNSLLPSDKELLIAEMELKIINLLIEMEVF